MRYGYFDDDNREYVITRWDTPLPWINYLGCEDYFGLISHTAGGYTFYKDARLRRLTRFRYNNVPPDTGGRMLYLRDEAAQEFWSPAWQPARRPVEAYSCRHGLGYTTIQSKHLGIEAQVRYFVPLGENLEIWELSLTNVRPSNSPTARLSIFSCVEFCLWDANDDSTNFQRNFNIGQVEVEGSVIYHKTEYRERRDHFAYFACSEPLAGFDTQRESFLGVYRGWETPQAVEQGASTNSIAYGWAPVGSHQVRLALHPGETRQIIFILGYQENPRDAKFDLPGSQTINKRLVAPTIARYLDPKNVQSGFDALGEYWHNLTGKYQVHSPDVHTDRMVNIWNAYQCMVTFNMSRSASYYESGVGRGLGFRDSNQDLFGFVHMVPKRARQRILDLAATQLENGGAYHQYQPLTKRGNNAVGGNFNDDPLWLVLATAAYLKETGDWKILDEQATYDSRPGTEAPLYNHLQRSMRYTAERLGPHGLPLIGRADWNDCLNLNTFSDTPGESFQTTMTKDGKVAESVFIAGLYVLAAKEMVEIAEQRGLHEEANRLLHEAESMAVTVLQHGWDGEWFLRAYDDFGNKVGSQECQEGQIYIEPQGICGMAGIGLESGHVQRAIDSVGKRLSTEHGILLHQPAYSRYYIHLGEISSYPPGYKENASVFCHTNPWIMIAETMLGRGDQAFEGYLCINPSAREAISEVHRCEPYVYAQTIAGRDAATFGEAKNSWLTGTAAYNYVAITQWILGIRPTYNGLRISPVIPAGWHHLQIERLYRGARYHISVERSGPGNRVALQVDGKPVEGSIVPLPGEGVSEVNVRALIA